MIFFIILLLGKEGSDSNNTDSILKDRFTSFTFQVCFKTVVRFLLYINTETGMNTETGFACYNHSSC